MTDAVDPLNMTSEPSERNCEMNDAAKHKINRSSTYLALILGGIALFFYVVAWLKFWH